MLRGRLLAIFAVLGSFAMLVPSVADAKAGKFGQRTLERGSSGKDVRVLQKYLTRIGHETTIDGRFGPSTEREVRSWEAEAAMAVDGRVTRRDARVLRRTVRATPKSAPRSEVESPGYQPAEADDRADTGGVGYVRTSKATLNADGTATPPADAPKEVKEIILAGNEIAKKPYRYGGGHGSWEDSGYDCSGSVSYALHGAGLLERSMPSGGFMSWEEPGPGHWVTIYANEGHMYMVVAGLRFDTSGAKTRGGSRWTAEMRESDGFVVRHPTGF